MGTDLRNKNSKNERLAEAFGIMTITAKRIKELREEIKFSQDDLAFFLRVSRTVVSNWENGKNLPSVAQYCDLAIIFRVDIEYLTGISDDRNNGEVVEKLRDFYEQSKILEADEDFELGLISENNILQNGSFRVDCLDLSIFNGAGRKYIKELYSMMKNNEKYLR